jgi:NADPH:quinone reductase-like Zn-dependent oxidoreductase
MRRVVVDHFGGPEVLRVVEDPRPGPGEVCVRVLPADVGTRGNCCQEDEVTGPVGFTWSGL